ncbi:MAG: hypothetical protein FWC26_01005 [Fibromonadales bacterium]|nr:hypothetical protein [Fibromonadales bacterium]
MKKPTLAVVAVTAIILASCANNQPTQQITAYEPVYTSDMTFAQESKSKIAVYVTGGKTAGENMALGNKIQTALVYSGKYSTIERGDAFLSEVAKEQEKQRSGSIDDSQISKLGKQFGVKFVCIANIVDAFGSKQVSTRIVDVETAEIVAIGEASSPLKTMEDLDHVSSKVVASMLSSIRSPEAVNTFTDPRDQRKYKIKRIGDYIWFLQDLAYETDVYSPYQSRKICPNGWRLPNNNEWNNLKGYSTPDVLKEFYRFSTGPWWSASNEANPHWFVDSGELKYDTSFWSVTPKYVRCIATPH